MSTPDPVPENPRVEMFLRWATATLVTAALTEALLFPDTKSAWSPLTLAALVTVPVAVGVTVIVIVTDAPCARLPMLHVTVPLACAHVPADAPVHVAAPNVTPAGSVSVIVTPVAPLGPLFVTTTA
jgi:hypothetical protein